MKNWHALLLMFVVLATIVSSVYAGVILAENNILHWEDSKEHLCLKLDKGV
jgi:hypothetical protein